MHGWGALNFWLFCEEPSPRARQLLYSRAFGARWRWRSSAHERRRVRSRDIKVLSVASSWFGFSRPLSKRAFKTVRGCVLSAVFQGVVCFFWKHTHWFGVDFSCNVAVRLMQEHLAFSLDAWGLECCVTCSMKVVCTSGLFVDWRQINAIVFKVAMFTVCLWPSNSLQSVSSLQ